MSAEILQYKTSTKPEDKVSTTTIVTIDDSVIDLLKLEYQEIVAYYNAAVKWDIQISSVDRSKCQCEIARRNIETIKLHTAQALDYHNRNTKIRLS